MAENPFNKPSLKEKQENNLLSFEKAKKLIKNGNSEYLVDNFEKLSKLKTISSENKKELYRIFQNTGINTMKLLELITVINCEVCSLFIFAKSFGKFINEGLVSQLEQALDRGCFK